MGIEDKDTETTADIRSDAAVKQQRRKLLRNWILPTKIGFAGLVVAVFIEMMVRDINVGKIIVVIGPLIYYTGLVIALPIAFMLLFGVRKLIFRKPYPEYGYAATWTLFWISAIVVTFMIWRIR